MLAVRFMNLDNGPFREMRAEVFATDREALAAVEAHAASAGFSSVRKVQDDEPWHVRYTARTPGGRAGRNIAFADYVPDDEAAP